MIPEVHLSCTHLPKDGVRFRWRAPRAYCSFVYGERWLRVIPLGRVHAVLLLDGVLNALGPSSDWPPISVTPYLAMEPVADGCRLVWCGTAYVDLDALRLGVLSSWLSTLLAVWPMPRRGLKMQDVSQQKETVYD